MESKRKSVKIYKWLLCPNNTINISRFAFAETKSADEIKKAVKAMDSIEIRGRRLRVRAAGDKDPKPDQG